MPPAIVLIETIRAVLNSRMRAKFGFVKMDLQKRTQEATLSGLLDNMSPSAIFNRFDLSASNGQHCGEYRVIYHKNNVSVLNSLSCHGRSTNVLERT
jgi:hypothetical protein